VPEAVTAVFAKQPKRPPKDQHHQASFLTFVCLCVCVSVCVCLCICVPVCLCVCVYVFVFMCFCGYVPTLRNLPLNVDVDRLAASSTSASCAGDGSSLRTAGVNLRLRGRQKNNIAMERQVSHTRKYTKTHRNTNTQTHRHKHTDTQTHRHTDTQIHRHTDTQTHRHTHRHTDTQTHRHTVLCVCVFCVSVCPCVFSEFEKLAFQS
jgi:hypothetical protein